VKGATIHNIALYTHRYSSVKNDMRKKNKLYGSRFTVIFSFRKYVYIRIHGYL